MGTMSSTMSICFIHKRNRSLHPPDRVPCPGAIDAVWEAIAIVNRDLGADPRLDRRIERPTGVKVDVGRRTKSGFEGQETLFPPARARVRLKSV